MLQLDKDIIQQQTNLSSEQIMEILARSVSSSGIQN